MCPKSIVFTFSPFSPFTVVHSYRAKFLAEKGVSYLGSGIEEQFLSRTTNFNFRGEILLLCCEGANLFALLATR